MSASSITNRRMQVLLGFVIVGGMGLIARAGRVQTPPPTRDDDEIVDPAGLKTVEDLPVIDTPDPADIMGTIAAVEAIDRERLLWHLPDPDDLRKEALVKAEEAKRALEEKRGSLRDLRADQVYYEKLAEYLKVISRPQKLDVPRMGAIRRALANSFQIRIASYNPAIETTRIVEAEAAFDATFFTNFTKTMQDIPTASELQGTQTDIFLVEGGLRQLLPSGMQVSTSVDLRREATNFQFQDFSPVYNSQFKVEFRQPMLRGFGIDFNRAQINVSKLDRSISDEAFARQVQDTLRDVEIAYWRVFQARRIVGIQARLLATFEQIYERLRQRGPFDVIPIQINETRARLESTKADFIRICNELRNAEDQLIALVNDPQFDLADDMELIPVDLPVIDPLVLDRLAEVQSALDHRQEIKEAQLQVNKASILVGAAKNQAMPRADLLFSYAVDGLGVSAHRAFSEVTKNDYHEYFVGVELEIPVGNRAPRAALQRARMQHGQAIASLKASFEQVIFDVNTRVREVLVQFNLILPNFDSAEASEAQVNSIRARAETQNYIQLSNELDALRALASNRSELLRALVEYNVAIVELERAKGTLLKFYNVEIPDHDLDRGRYETGLAGGF